MKEGEPKTIEVGDLEKQKKIIKILDPTKKGDRFGVIEYEDIFDRKFVSEIKLNDNGLNYTPSRSGVKRYEIF